MEFTFTVTVQVERVSGKFASKDEIGEEIMDWLESADGGSVSGVGADGDSEYEVTDFTVTDDTTYGR